MPLMDFELPTCTGTVPLQRRDSERVNIVIMLLAARSTLFNQIIPARQPILYIFQPAVEKGRDNKNNNGVVGMAVKLLIYL